MDIEKLRFYRHRENQLTNHRTLAGVFALATSVGLAFVISIRMGDQIPRIPQIPVAWVPVKNYHPFFLRNVIKPAQEEITRRLNRVVEIAEVPFDKG